jgi:hypothetical protein
MTTICRHIRVTGQRCGSPALRNHSLCYFHHRTQQRAQSQPNSFTKMQIQQEVTDVLRRHGVTDDLTAQYFGYIPQPADALDLPPLEDPSSIQLAISMLVSALGQKRLDPKLGGVILYGLQLASHNARVLDTTLTTVSETMHDEHGNELAADNFPTPPEINTLPPTPAE